MNVINTILQTIENSTHASDKKTHNMITKFKALPLQQKKLLLGLLNILQESQLISLRHKYYKITNSLTHTISIPWSIEDVKAERPDLNNKQASQVLEELERVHDATIGINWEVIQCVADSLYPNLH